MGAIVMFFDWYKYAAFLYGMLFMHADVVNLVQKAVFKTTCVTAELGCEFIKK